MDIKEKIKQLNSMQETLLNKVEGEKRDMTEGERIEYNGREVEIRALEVAAGQPANAIPMPAAGGSASRKSFGGIGLGYRGIYYPNGRSVPGSDDEVEAYLKRAIETRTINTGSGSEGGYFAPESLVTMVTDPLLSESITYGRVYQFPSLQNAGSVLRVASFDSTDQSLGRFGSVSASFVGELQQFSTVTPLVKNITYTLYKYIMGIDLSRESIEDCGSLATAIARLMTLNMALGIDECIIRGTGLNQPLGILNAPASLPVSRVGALAVTYPDLVAMLGKLHPNCRNAIWIVSPTVLPQLLGMVDGANHYIWQPSAVGSAAGAVPTSLLGRPLFISDMASALGTTGDVILADFGFYGFVTKQGVIVEQTNAARWTEDAVSMRCVWRLDGSPLLTAPITSRNSGGTLSPFVILD